MGVDQNSGPFLGTLNNRCRIIIGTQKGTIILTTTHMQFYSQFPKPTYVEETHFYFVGCLKADPLDSEKKMQKMSMST